MNPSSILKNKPIKTGAMSVYPYDPNLERFLVQESRFGDVVSLSERQGDHLLVPRALAPVGLQDARTDGVAINCKHKIVPRDDDQLRVMDVIDDEIEAGHSFLVQAPTGSGKTVLGIRAIVNHGRQALVIVPKSDLMDQWRARIAQFTDIPPQKIGIIQEHKCIVAGMPIVIGMLHSVVIPDRVPGWAKTMFGMIVWDEVHRIAADTFMQSCTQFPARIRIGFSAEPKRIDGKEFVLYSHIGPVRVISHQYPMTPKILVYQSGWKVPWTKDKYGFWNQMKHTANKSGHVINEMCKDAERNEFLCKLVYQAFAKDRRMIVFSDRRSHLKTLAKMLPHAGVSSNNLGFYVSGMSKTDLDLSLGKKVILATYQMLGEGTDAPWVDTCLLATPRAHVKQFVGRVIRQYEGKKDPVVMDVRDSDSHVFRGFGETRDSLYKSMKAPVKKL